MNMEADATEPIDCCLHDWRTEGDRKRCVGPCGTVLVGKLAQNPPTIGMDWSRAVRVVSVPRWTRRPAPRARRVVAGSVA